MNENTPATLSQNAPPASDRSSKVNIALATQRERRMIYQVRHDIYATELAQHPLNNRGLLRDPLDAFNVYITATVGAELVGFISVTPPAGSAYSLDKYVQRS